MSVIIRREQVAVAVIFIPLNDSYPRHGTKERRSLEMKRVVVVKAALFRAFLLLPGLAPAT